jgi:hypothetical protein
MMKKVREKERQRKINIRPRKNAEVKIRNFRIWDYVAYANHWLSTRN